MDPGDLRRDPIEHYPAATVACFDATTGDLPRRRLDPQQNARFLQKLAEARVPAVLIGASTGQGHLRTAEELGAWLRASAAAPLGPTVRMALLRPEDGEETNRRLVALAAELDYQVIFVRPGRDLAPAATDAQVADNMRPLVRQAAEAGLAVGVYSIPDVSGMRLTPAAAARLVEGAGGDGIVAVKVTEADYQESTRRFLESPALAHLKIVQGWDPHLAQALQEGPQYDTRGRQRCGVTSGPMSFAIFQYLHLLAAAAAGNWSEVAASQQAVTLLFTSMQDDPRKFADLQRAKYVMGLGHPVLGTVTHERVERLLTALMLVPRAEDRQRLARSLDLLGTGPYHERLRQVG